MGVVKPVSLESAAGEQLETGKFIYGRLGGRLNGPSAIYLHNPGFARIFDEIRAYFAAGGGLSLSPRIAELCMLITVRFWSAKYAWALHAVAGVKAGLSEDIVEALRNEQRPDFTKEDEEAVYDFVSATLERRPISEAVQKKAMDQLGEVGLVELISVCGIYSLVGQTCTVFDIELPDGESSPFD
ncbi:MAG: hypothetical protein QGF09_01770 [Rhodospirillales bacterium]|jgi:4-carboxymuconolactone decarboxylase|nr:hypothetical protein [Rhodospirillales bacterium]